MDTRHGQRDHQRGTGLFPTPLSPGRSIDKLDTPGAQRSRLEKCLKKSTASPASTRRSTLTERILPLAK